jgi:hypothetical protein
MAETVGAESLHNFRDRFGCSSPDEILKEAVQVRSSYPAPHAGTIQAGDQGLLGACSIFVTEGVGLCQREGGAVEVIRPGDSVFFEPGENHWHGAAPKRFMVHTAMQESDESGTQVTWGKHVTEKHYTTPTS